jgi:NRAMP (natural resistance-associated macrophage protein)-like metal ion transporter
MGPGIITANVDNDAGGITTYSVCGATYGLSMVWALIPITIALIVVQEMSCRMPVVTGKGLADLIREQWGVKITFYILLALVITNLGNILAEFAGVAWALEIFGISPYISVPLSAIFVWVLVVKGTYGSVEKVFLAACVFYICYIVTGFMIEGNWPHVLRSVAVPSFKFDHGFLFMMIGLIGTTIAPWMQFYQHSSIIEKGLRPDRLRYSQIDVITGCIVVNVVALFIILVCGETLFKAGVKIETAGDAAQALKPLAGKYCAYLFSFGLLNASLFAASILPLSTAYTVCEGFGWESGVNKKFAEAPQFYGLYTFLILIGMIVMFVPVKKLVFIMLVSQVVNGILLPVTLACVVILINKKKLMGAYTNGPIMNIIAWATTIIMSVLSILLVLSGLGII